MENVPSLPRKPSGAAFAGRYRNTSESSTSVFPIAASVERHRGSLGLMNFTNGISNDDASTVFAPRYCTNDFNLGFQK